MHNWEWDDLRSANDELRGQFDRARQSFDEEMSRIHDQRADIRASAHSADRLVEVTVGSDGMLVGLRFAPGATLHPGPVIARAVTEAAGLARRSAAEQTQAAIALALAATEDMTSAVEGAEEIGL